MTNKSTIKVVKTAFYDGGLVYAGEIIKNYKGDKIPSWATLANGKEAVKKEVKKEEETAANENKTPAAQTQEAITAEYNALLDEAVEKNILIEDADKKTITEQIAELKVLLGKE